LANWDIQLQGLDANPAMLKKAKAGRYSGWALRQLPPDVEARWFRPQGRDFLLDPAIRAMADFAEHNLAADSSFWQPARFDIVFCRNVLMYFSPAAARAAVERIARSLVPGGFLFLGHAESLRGLSDDFDLRHSHDAFYYQRRLAPAPADPPPLPVPARVPPPRPVLAPPAPAKLDMAQALSLLAAERLVQLRAWLEALPPALSESSEALLLHAVLAAQAGDPARARAFCSRLMGRNEKGAGAHYLTALACESIGDAGAAARHDRAATVLDPGFAMARLHLGLLARRAGRRDEAARELRQALPLLAHEEPSRLVLFGGGFSRAALLTLCRAELEAL
jgi:chemotaxis protein methyltransferase CheR